MFAELFALVCSILASYTKLWRMITLPEVPRDMILEFRVDGRSITHTKSRTTDKVTGQVWQNCRVLLRWEVSSMWILEAGMMVYYSWTPYCNTNMQAGTNAKTEYI